jgi:hypothetical protein
VFEAWKANLDGTNLQQITRTRTGTENPSITPDGQYLIYTSGGGGTAGITRSGSDGSNPTMLVRNAILPEISPDGRYLAFLSNRDPSRPAIGVVRVSDGVVLPFTIAINIRTRAPVLLGRSRWTPDGSALVFIGQAPNGRTGLYRQAFDPEATDTSATRTELAGFSSESDVESFDFDDEVVIVAEAENRTGILAVTDLPP